MKKSKNSSPIQIKELGHVVLYVSNLKRSVGFYRDILGFPEVAQLGNVGAMFSGGRTHHELLLLEVGGKPQQKGLPKPGLYHIGLKIGNDPEDIRRAWRELNEKGVKIIGKSDHTVTHSIYIEDPDGNEIELYADVSDEWKKNSRWADKPTKELKIDDD